MSEKLVTRSIIKSEESPLLVLVHGRAGNVNVMWNFSRAFPENINVVSFQAPFPDPQDGGFSWWLLSESLKDGCNNAASVLKENIESWISENRLKPSKIIGAGFSQGAVLLSHLLQTTELFSGLALLSGFVFEAEQSFSKDAKVFMYHGTEDDILPFSKAEQGRDYLVGKGYHVEFLSEAATHKVGISGMRGFKAFLAQS